MRLLALMLCLSGAPKGRALDEGTKALVDFRPEEAIALLERAKTEGPYRYTDHAKLYEQLGIAYAYLERSEDALAAFDTLLAIDPARAISYTLSPKVTFLFEQARSKAMARTPPTVQVSWPSDLKVNEEIPIEVEVVTDPKDFLKSATIHYRRRGGLEFDESSFDLAAAGTRHRIAIPPVDADHPDTLEIYLTAFDDRKNEVLEWGSEKRPREVALGFAPPTPFYGRWWFWAIAGTAVAGGAAAAALALTNEPGSRVSATAGFE
jgi:tetratricopeptide (TPR) repeat protein